MQFCYHIFKQVVVLHDKHFNKKHGVKRKLYYTKRRMSRRVELNRELKKRSSGITHLSYIWLCIYLYISSSSKCLENAIRCPVLLASDEVMKCIFPSKVSVFFHCTVLAKGYPLLHLTLTINQIDNLTITISARNAFPEWIFP